MTSIPRPRLPLSRRALLRAAALAAPLPAVAATAATGVRPRALVFPTDFGAHPDTRTEWWYATGWLADPARPREPTHGFQVTFFRSRTGLGEDIDSAFAARQLIFAHAALSDLGERRQRHDQRLAREGFGRAGSRTGDTRAWIGDWQILREAADVAADGSARSRYRARVGSSALGGTLELVLRTTQPLLAQGQDGFSRKGPDPSQASHYYSQPQLAVEARWQPDGPGPARALAGRGWLDHEWSETLLHPEAVGWDWIGMNLDDGGALTAFRLRRADGSALWAGGSWRAAGETRARAFAPDEVRFSPLRTWTSAATGARYPVEWQVETPVGRWTVRSLLDAQELDSRGSTGTVYWEGLSELRNAAGTRTGLGYLEMTGYAGRLAL